MAKPSNVIVIVCFVLCTPFIVDGKYHLTDLADRKVVRISDYSDKDQCMLKGNGQKNVMSHRIKVQIAPEDICTGGLVLCYPGQMDPKNTATGRRVSVQYMLNNAPDNEVAKVCEEAQKKFLDNCQKGDQTLDEIKLCAKWHFASGPWHGFRLTTNDTSDGAIVRIELSTRNYSVSFLRLEKFFIKLGGWHTLHTTISSSNGPTAPFSFMQAETRRREDMHRIPFWEGSIDDNLRDEFIREPERSRLSYYAGLWSLGLDVLPPHPIQEMWIYAEKGECCEMEAMFLPAFHESDGPNMMELAKKRIVEEKISKNTMHMEIGEIANKSNPEEVVVHTNARLPMHFNGTVKASLTLYKLNEPPAEVFVAVHES